MTDKPTLTFGPFDSPTKKIDGAVTPWGRYYRDAAGFWRNEQGNLCDVTMDANGAVTIIDGDRTITLE